VGNAARLVRLPGTKNCKGAESAGRSHGPCQILQSPKKGHRVVPKHLLERFADKLSVQASSQAVAKPPAPAEVIDWARSYVAKMEPAVSHEHGHNATYRVACRLVIGFDLSVEEALPVLREYSQRCRPPWTEQELRHKLEDADKEPDPRGLLRHRFPAKDSYAAWEPLDGPQFVGYIPDFAYADAAEVLCPLDRWNKLSFKRILRTFCTWVLQRSDVLIPDRWIPQFIWGATRPRNWRALLSRSYKLRAKRNHRQARVCQEPCCLLHGMPFPHNHISMSSLHHYGVLEVFAENGNNEHRRFQLHHNSRLAEKQEQAKNGSLIKAYWPALLFGFSPRIGWTGPQRRLVLVPREPEFWAGRVSEWK
jgi:hypothetical protein